MTLPPLNAVRVFEVAARLSSFKLAAAELNVTPGAVTKQIQLLECHAGVDLFAREHRSVRLTDAGVAYLGKVTEAFGLLQEDMRKPGEGDRQMPLHVWCTSLFMQYWLMPRLADFRRVNPDQEITLTIGTSAEKIPSDIDVAIRHGTKLYPGYRSHFLMGVHVTPVCSPDYLVMNPPLDQPEDLARHTLLRSTLRPEVWTTWQRTADLKGQILRKPLNFPNAGSAFRAAIEGLGVAMGYRGFIDHELKAKRLTVPFDITVELDGGYYLCYHDSRKLSDRVRRFREWILPQARHRIVHDG